MTDSANNPLAQGADQAPAGLDDLLASVLSGEDEQPKKRGRKKKKAPAKDFKAVLGASADKPLDQMDAAEYKHLVLGLNLSRIQFRYLQRTKAKGTGSNDQYMRKNWNKQKLMIDLSRLRKSMRKCIAFINSMLFAWQTHLTIRNYQQRV